MQQNRRWLLTGVLIAAIAAGGCANKAASSAESEGEKAATLIVVDGSDIPRVKVTDLGARRIGLAMAAVEGGESSTVPYSAIVYDPNGGTWVYTSPKNLVVRADAGRCHRGPGRSGSPVQRTGPGNRGRLRGHLRSSTEWNRASAPEGGPT